jgi:hypothetical protein
MQSKLFGITFVIVFMPAFAVVIWANAPAPPANQQIGFPDGVFNSLEETDCRLCHENPDQFPVDPESIPDRHHLLMFTPIGDPSSAPFAGPPGNFDCLSCHDVDCSTGVCNINVYRDCLFCHQQVAGEASVHHLTAAAQAGDCVSCHGDIVDNMDDGHIIFTYQPSFVTPRPSGAAGLPLNSEGSGAGACDYCHSTGNGTSAPGTDIETGISVYKNKETHHEAGFGNDATKCYWCHNVIPPESSPSAIRVCEGCHGYESLHNIQIDSDNDGIINPGIEMPYYGHIGDPDDCWGCHGFSLASAPGSGPITPHIRSSDISVITVGSDTPVTLTGSAFTNLIGTIQLVSDIVLTASDGSTTELTPDNISENLITVTIPGTVATGNYNIQAVKDTTKSNPIVIHVKPAVTITDVDCRKRRGRLVIRGSDFSEKIEGTDSFINVKVNGEMVDIISWKDDKIKASVTGCSTVTNVRVNALFGSAVSGDDKPPKP